MFANSVTLVMLSQCNKVDLVAMCFRCRPPFNTVKKIPQVFLREHYFLPGLYGGIAENGLLSPPELIA